MIFGKDKKREVNASLIKSKSYLFNLASPLELSNINEQKGISISALKFKGAWYSCPKTKLFDKRVIIKEHKFVVPKSLKASKVI